MEGDYMEGDYMAYWHEVSYGLTVYTFGDGETASFERSGRVNPR